MKENRRKRILEILSEQRIVNSEEIAKEFHVSMETVRRDMEALEKEEVIRRVHGGAVLNVRSYTEPEFTNREKSNFEQKISIGKIAADMVKDGETIIIDIGTTTVEMARFLKGKKIFVITNSMNIAAELMKDDSIKVLLLGGMIRNGEGTTSGHWAENMVSEFRADKLFFGVGCIDTNIGIMDYDIEEANLRRQFIKCAQTRIALADYSKFGWRAMNCICKIRDIDTIITDPNTDKRMIQKIRDEGVNVVIAGNNK